MAKTIYICKIQMDMKTVLPSELPRQCLSLSYFQSLEINIAGGYPNGKNIFILNVKKFSHLQIDLF
jgi:hypothetical protein